MVSNIFTQAKCFCNTYRYRDTNVAVQDLYSNSDDCKTYKWYSLLNRKVTDTDTQYVSRVLILIYSMLSMNFNSY